MNANLSRLATDAIRPELEEALRGSDVNRLLKIRVKLVEKKKSIESQLADDTADLRGDRADLLASGMHPREADLRAQAAGDPDWRARASGLNRIIDGMLSKIRQRLSELTANQNYAAVVIQNGASTASNVASAINSFLGRGCKIGHAIVVGNDLVLVASEPAA